MKLIQLFFALLLITGITGCGDDDTTVTATSQTDRLVANNWQVLRVTDTNGNEISQSRLNATTRLLFVLTMQFRADGTVRALDPNQSNNVINGGTWSLTTDNTSIDVDVNGFEGNFPIVRLDRRKLILRQRAPVDGQKTDTDINLEFDPSL